MAGKPKLLAGVAGEVGSAPPERLPVCSVLDTSLYRKTFGGAPPPWQRRAASALEMIFAA
jgi:hypothetical protein